MFPLLLLHDARQQCWLRFTSPIGIVTALNIDEVIPALESIEKQLLDRQTWAAGFISYEASPAFDSALVTHPPDGMFPLLWFGLFNPPERSPDLDELAPEPGGFQLGEWIPTTSREAYDHGIERIKKHIALGNTYQVNYTLRLRTGFKGQTTGLFLQLMQAQPTQYAAFLDLERFSICSASPELFLQIDEERLASKPMKGTVGRGLTPESDRANARWLHVSSKNRAENVMIVDMIRSDLGRIAQTGSVEVPRLFDVERHPTVWQMTSTVTASSRKSVTEILCALFPCASITGAPKPRTMQIIRELEDKPRHIYTGCIGYIAPNRQAQFNIAIRTILVDKFTGHAEYGVGGGIVWDSTANNEYEECQIKTRVLTEQKPVFSLLESILWNPGEGFTLLEYHYRRLDASAEYFAYPFDQAAIQNSLDALAAGLQPEPHKIRLLLDRYGAIECMATPLAQIPKPNPSRLQLALKPVDSQSLYLYHKTTHREVYNRARSNCPNCDEVILWNEREEITETTSANLAFELNGELLTPPVSSGLLAGTYRAWMLDQGLVKEKVVKISDLERCSKIIVINSIREPRTGILVDQ
ncbi:MAG: aminodeoxychorismate synthase component I [Anaerolineales bacterium]|nr:aminodeoxychorismate synthase component I [Anaerolineales bacterium]